MIPIKTHNVNKNQTKLIEYLKTFIPDVDTADIWYDDVSHLYAVFALTDFYKVKEDDYIKWLANNRENKLRRICGTSLMEAT